VTTEHWIPKYESTQIESSASLHPPTPPTHFSLKAILVIILTHILQQDIKKICETDISILGKSNFVSFLYFIRSTLAWWWPSKSRNCCNKRHVLGCVDLYNNLKVKIFLPVQRSPTGCVWSRNLNNEVAEAPAGLLCHRKKKIVVLNPAPRNKGVWESEGTNNILPCKESSR
jgi:hypothetical protein